MYPIELLQGIAEQIKKSPVVTAEVISGSHCGDKLVYAGEQILYQDDPSGFLLEHGDQFRQMATAGRVVLGEQQVFVDLLSGRKRLVICGAGHVSIPIIRMGKMLGFHVTVLEDRPEFANHARMAGADQVICETFAKGLEQIEGDKSTFFVIVTRGHRFDEECLQAIFEKERAYVGMMGSKGRVLNVKRDMEAAGIAPEQIATLHAPIGEAIGAETPEEIAVSVMAQVIRVHREEKTGTEGMQDVLTGVFEETFRALKKVMVTVVEKRGAAPRDVGTKMLILEDGRTCGTIGGGCAEASVIQVARQMMTEEQQNGLPDQRLNGDLHAGGRLLTVDMTGQDAAEDGMACGGIQEVFLEPVGRDQG